MGYWCFSGDSFRAGCGSGFPYIPKDRYTTYAEKYTMKRMKEADKVREKERGKMTGFHFFIVYLWLNEQQTQTK